MKQTWRETTADGTNDYAAAEVISTIMLVSIMAAAVTITMFVVFSTYSPPQKIPSFSALVTNQSCSIYIYHDGGDTVQWQLMKILVDSSDWTANFTMRGRQAGWTTWETGDTLVYTPPACSTLPGRVDIVFDNSYVVLSAVFGYTPAAPPTGSYTHTITASAGTNGAIAPSGSVVVIDRASQSFTITANTGYQIYDVLVDGVSNGTLSGYTFTDITADHTISATFGVPTVANFTGTPLSGTAPLSVTFTDSSTGTPTSWKWEYRNATTGWTQFNTTTQPNPTFIFPGGTYSINLTATNDGGSSNLTRNSYITVTTPPVADFTNLTPRSGNAPLPVAFTDTSTNTPTSWKWEYRTATVGWTQFGTTQNPSFTFPSGIYSINLTASNAGGSDYETKNNYITVTPSPPWYSCSWGYRKNITIYKNSVNGAHTSFPVLINLTTDNDLKTSARTDGFDILFTSSDGTTKLNHEIESYNSGNGALLAWVNVPFVNSSYNNTIYMYYGYPTATDQQNKNGVWDTNYRGVWHLKQNPAGAAPQMMDSTSYGNHGTSAGTMTTSDQVAGKIDGSLDFDGSNDLVNCGQDASLNLRSAVTMEAWINASVYNAQWNDLMSKLNYDTYISKGKLCAYFITNAGTYDACPAGGQTMVVGTWYHVAVIYNAGSITTYINGAQDGTASKGATINDNSGSNFNIGYHDSGNGLYWQGRADEVRISSVARSADWIQTEYNNQNSPSTFYSLGNQEQWTC